MAADPDHDPRYSLANERTFLAWIRTALGFLAASAGLFAIDLPWPGSAVRGLAILLALVGGTSAFLAWRRWRAVELAIKDGRDAPTPHAHVLLAAGVGLVALAVVVLAAL